MGEENVMISLDFENLAISAEEAYPSKERPLSIGPIIDYANTKGNICVKKAYADWSNQIYTQYQKTLSEHGFELTHMPSSTLKGKNSSDMKLAIDAMEIMERFPMIDTFIVGSGDTDFIPLIQRIRARGNKAIVIGFEHSVGGLLKKNSTEYRSLEELLGQPDKDSLSSDMIDTIEESDGRKLLIRFISNRNNPEPIPMASLKKGLLRLDPSFSEKKLGFSSFTRFLESMKDDLVEQIETTQTKGLKVVYLTDREIPPEDQRDDYSDAEIFLKARMKFISDAEILNRLSSTLYQGMQNAVTRSRSEMIEFLFERTEQILPKMTIRKFINVLFNSGSFSVVHGEAMRTAALYRQYTLDKSINDHIILNGKYYTRIMKILENRYPGLETKEIEQLLRAEKAPQIRPET